MEGARPFRSADLPHCENLLHAALGAARHLRGGPQLLAGLAAATALTGAWAPEGTGPARRSGLDEAAGPSPAALLETWTHGTAHRLVVGTVDDEVVGLAAGHCITGGGDMLGVVDCIYVEPEARGIGVGTATAQALLAWFGAQGCRGVDAPALPGDRETKQLFESLGLSARLLVLHRRLP